MKNALKNLKKLKINSNNYSLNNKILLNKIYKEIILMNKY
jgi:hypothetical protein